MLAACLAGRMIAEYAAQIGAGTIVIGAPSHGGLPALMDASASRELERHTSSNILIVNPDAPGTLIAATGRERLKLGGPGLVLAGRLAPPAPGAQAAGQVLQRRQGRDQGVGLLGGQVATHSEMIAAR